MSPSMSVQVARELGRRIVTGTFEPGSLIDDETTLAERYHVSRVVIRDAIKILVGKGLLDVRRGIGTQVKPRNQWIMLDDDVLAWHLSAPPNVDFVNQLMDVRLAFEPKMARWAAERGTEEDLQEIEKACIRMEEEEGSMENFVKADAMFHRAVLKAAHNEFLTAMEGVIYSALMISIQITNKDPRDNETSLPFHRQLCDAITSRDGETAEELTGKLLKDASRRLHLAVG